ncbi:TetR/AcrR family transcriptional regulator [Homoserinimonas sp. OAct 916]|uniref:TetR/AcrR family transcriptional regulator n=1 Tax=Homoserinimonas sp. OAct 916 TaxID=2211450 RepID=UPI000DBE83A3|nr:TetR/AcrR family transcriptional regulator [Homoserinimonas sp. OAct 916]
MARPKRQEARRSELVAAAQRAIIGHGPGLGLHHVAEEAGLTSGAVLYYYPNLDELVLEANRAGMERFYEQRSRMLNELPDDPVDRLLALIRSGLPADRTDEGVRFLCELGGSAGRNPTAAALLTTLFDRQVSLYQVVLEQGAARGIFKLTQGSLTIARNLVALEDAYGYRIVAQHPVIDHAGAAELIIAFARMSTGHPLIPAGTAASR